MGLDRLRFVIVGGGFLGANLAQYLAGKAGNVKVFGRRWMCGHVLDGVEIINGEIGDTESVRRAVRGCDVVVNVSGSFTPELANARVSGGISDLVLTAVELLEICRDEGVRQVAVASSGGTVYGKIGRDHSAVETDALDPIGAYGIAKVTLESYMRFFELSYGLKCISLRIANPYGPFQRTQKKQGLVGTVLERTIDGGVVEIWGDGLVVRDYIFAEDVARAFAAAALYGGCHRVFNIGTGVGTSIVGLVTEAERVVGKPVRIEWKDGRGVDVPRNVLCCALARRELEWWPLTNLAAGLKLTQEWIIARRLLKVG